MKNVYLFIYLSLSVFFACKPKNNNHFDSNLENLKRNNSESVLEKKDSTINSNEETLIIENTDSIVNTESELEPEYLSETKFINNEYPAWGERENLESFVVKVDSINKPGDECGGVLDDSHEIWYYLNNEIEVSNTDYVFRKIDFYFSNFTVKYKDIVFSKDYTLSHFKKDFPFSFLKNKIEEDNGVITVNISSHPLADGIYVFKFKNEKLIELSYFFPC